MIHKFEKMSRVMQYSYAVFMNSNSGALEFCSYHRLPALPSKQFDAAVWTVADSTVHHLHLCFVAFDSKGFCDSPNKP